MKPCLNEFRWYQSTLYLENPFTGETKKFNGFRFIAKSLDDAESKEERMVLDKDKLGLVKRIIVDPVPDAVLDMYDLNSPFGADMLINDWQRDRF